MTIDALKTLFDLKGNEYQLGYIGGDEFNLLANQAQNDYFNFLIGHIEQYQYGRPVPRIGVKMGVGVMDKLSPFRKRSEPIPDESGFVAKPSNVARVLRFGSSNSQEIRQCDLTELSAKISSVIVPITSNPIYIDIGSTYQIFPTNYTNGGTVLIDYIEQPTQMKWNHTTLNGRENYLEQDSVHPQWRDIDMGHILSRMLKQKGVVFKDGEQINIANTEISQGE